MKYFTIPDDASGVRLTAGIRGPLAIIDNCLKIGGEGGLTPFLHSEVLVRQDYRGIYLRHKDGGRKYRVGDIIRGGGGQSSEERAKAMTFHNGDDYSECPGPYRSFWIDRR